MWGQSVANYFFSLFLLIKYIKYLFLGKTNSPKAAFSFYEQDLEIGT